VDLFYWHGLVSYENYHKWSTGNCRITASEDCNHLENEIFNEIGEINQELVDRPNEYPKQPSLDPDDLYQNFCTDNATLAYTAENSNDCSPIGVRETTYLQRADVQAAIHADEKLAPAKWSSCSNAISYNVESKPMVPHYIKFSEQKPGFKVLVYSGDVDIYTGPFAITQPCVMEIGSARKTKWVNNLYCFCEVSQF
jgi:hypothetical protein